MQAANTTQGDPGRYDSRETEWAGWMRQSLAGDGAAYRRLLAAMAPTLRAMVRRGLARYGAGNGDAEDVVQEILLAVHVKRHTWLSDQPFTPWLNAIARYKLIDVLRRKGRRNEVPIDNFIEILPDESEAPETSAPELTKLVGSLSGREHDVVAAISLNGASIKDAAQQFSLSEGAVRVALHRGLKRLARLHCSQTT